MGKGHIASNSCRYCKKPGHLKHNCPICPPRNDQKRSQPHPNSSKHVLAAATTTGDTSSPSQFAFSASDLESLLKQILSTSGNASVALSTTSGNICWYFDSACCNHMTSTSQAFSSVSVNDTTRHIHIADAGSTDRTTHKDWM